MTGQRTAAPWVAGGGDPQHLLRAGLELVAGVAEGEVPGAGFYDGAAGVGWTLAHAAAYTGDPHLAAAARARLAAAEAAARDAPLGLGIADGTAGIAFALATAARALDDRELRAAARAAAARTAEHAAAGGDERGAEYLSGLAGAVVALAAIRRVDPEAPAALLDAARAAGEHVLAAAERTPWGWGWHVPGLTGGEVPPLCGAAHGSAGVALALHELARATGEARWAAAAGEALTYVGAFFRRRVCGWPDLRVARAGDEAVLDASCPTTWCHGAAGIGLAFLRVHDLTGDAGALADATAALQSARAAVAALAPSRPAGGASADASLCHGTGGIVELYTCAAELLGVQDHLRAARRVARLGLGVARRNGGAWRSGDPDGADTPGLYLGRAGVAAWLLRAGDPAALPSPLLLR